jgi:hypothetical protein
MKSIDPNDFKVVSPIKLSELPSNPKIGASDDKKEDKLDNVRESLVLQDITHNHYAVLICLRAWTHLERQFDTGFREFSSWCCGA